MKILKLLLVFAVAFLLGSCSMQRKPLLFDVQKGVRYSRSLDNSYNTVTINLDEETNNKITKILIYINYTPSLLELIDPEKSEQERSEYLNKIEKEAVPFQNQGIFESYWHSTEPSIYCETIEIKFYEDHYNFIDNKELLQFLGLWEAYDKEAQAILYDRLLETEEFRYRFMFEIGEYENDISFFQNHPH